MNQKILHHLAMPGEAAEYRAARNKLLAEEMALRRQIESVAGLRRALSAGGDGSPSPCARRPARPGRNPGA